jgi:predicted ATP-dependent endonuclease of OLD family
MVLCQFGSLGTSENTIIGTIFELEEQQIVYNIVNSNSIKLSTLVPKYAINLIKQITEKNVLYLTERRQSIGQQEAALLFDLKNTREKVKDFHEIKKIVANLLGVDIEVFISSNPSSGNNLETEIDIDKFIVQANGAGILEALRLILDYELNQPDILLIEEPEIHLHPALETVIMRYLKLISKKCQIFITTHSTNFLDTAEMRNVYLVSREGRQGSTNIQLIDSEKAEENLDKVEESILRELGIRLSSVFMYERLVFVEGKTDEKVIREWASICGLNLVQASVGFVAIDGVRNFTHYATKKTIEFLCKRRVLVFFILDRDERNQDDINFLKNKLEDRGQLIVLDKRELENYLLCPRAIVEFIKNKYRLGGRGEINIDINDIENAIDKCVEELKSDAVQRRVIKSVCLPIYLNRSSLSNLDSVVTLTNQVKEQYTNLRNKLTEAEAKLETIIEKETAWVETKWEKSKRDIVPGDIVLENVCKQFGVNFDKTKDSVILASFMKEDEIDLEIKNKLKFFMDLR